MCIRDRRKLKEKCDIPIFHDDQHGTAVITLAGLTNALKVVGKKLEDIKIAVNGAGAAAIAITKLLLSAGAKDVTLWHTQWRTTTTNIARNLIDILHMDHFTRFDFGYFCALL